MLHNICIHLSFGDVVLERHIVVTFLIELNV